jgi:basic membrane protein A and related proteins
LSVKGRVSRRAVVLSSLAAAVLGLGFVRGRHDTSGSEPTNGFRVGLVFDVGGRGDKSFNDLSWAGLSRAQKELSVYTEFVEPTGAEDREAALRLFAARGFDLVIGVGFIFSRDIDEVAKAYPKTRFACVDYAPPFAPGVPIPPNVTGLAFREHEGSFLVGAVAGLTSKTKHVGFVGGMDIPLIHKFEAGYRAGVKAVCDECQVHGAYAGTTPDAFRDPAKGKAIAHAQIAARSDVIFHASGSTGLGVFGAARDAHVFAIGVDADQWDEAPNTMLTSMTKQADVSVFDAIAAAKRGELASGMRVLGLKENGVDYVHDGPHAIGIAPDVKARVEALRADIIAGRVTVPSE